MAHYAKLDENNLVIDCIVIANADCLDENGNENEEKGRQFCQALTGHASWKKTSFNTKKGIYYDPNTGEPSSDQSKAFRINFGGKGMLYDESLDGFVQPETQKLNTMMELNTETGYYEYITPSVPLPEDRQLEQYPLEIYRGDWHWDVIENRWVKVPLSVDRGSRYINQRAFYPEE